MAEEDDLAELVIEVDHPTFGAGGVIHLLDELVAVFIEVDEPHLEEGQAEDFVVAGGVAEDVFGQVGLDCRP